MMGFGQVDARKALKLTGDVNQAVNLLLSGQLNLGDISDSEDEEKKKKDES